MPGKQILTINVGSSSLKFALFNRQDLSPTLRGLISEFGGKLHLTFKLNTGNQPEPEPLSEKFSIDMALGWLLAWLDKNNYQFDAVGHRVVHGGEYFTGAVIVDDEVIAKLQSLARLAPLHQPYNMAAVESIRDSFPGIIQVTCFDTAFHHSVPVVASALALPKSLRDQGLRRYGFHGLAYEYVVHYLREHHPEVAEGKILAAHLGSGCSACAIENGKSVDSSMGFTAVDGLPMGTRCGSVDPGLIHYLFDQMEMSSDEVQKIIYKKSGLLGLSSESADMRVLLESYKEDAQFAVECFVYQVVKHLGALHAVLGGVDALVFSGGVGENSPTIREKIRSRFLTSQQFPDFAVPVDEEWIIARDVQECLNKS